VRRKRSVSRERRGRTAAKDEGGRKGCRDGSPGGMLLDTAFLLPFSPFFAFNVHSAAYKSRSSQQEPKPLGEAIPSASLAMHHVAVRGCPPAGRDISNGASHVAEPGDPAPTEPQPHHRLPAPAQRRLVSGPSLRSDRHRASGIAGLTTHREFFYMPSHYKQNSTARRRACRHYVVPPVAGSALPPV